MFVCPHCHKQVKRLKDHLKRVHADKAGAPGPVAIEKLAIPKQKITQWGPKSTAKQFEVKVVKESKPAKQSYKCGACGVALDGEVSSCPSCGAELTWS